MIDRLINAARMKKGVVRDGASDAQFSGDGADVAQAATIPASCPVVSQRRKDPTLLRTSKDVCTRYIDAFAISVECR
jgi:hypothetical protein